jgi:hypothetical protein
MRDNGQTKGCEVPKTKQFDTTKQFTMTAIKEPAPRLGKPIGSVKFPEGDEKLLAVPRARRASAATDVADQIGLRLRIVYDDVLTQPVPDRFFDLLRQLEGDSGSSKRNDL